MPQPLEAKKMQLHRNGFNTCESSLIKGILSYPLDKIHAIDHVLHPKPLVTKYHIFMDRNKSHFYYQPKSN